MGEDLTLKKRSIKIHHGSSGTGLVGDLLMPRRNTKEGRRSGLPTDLELRQT
jgi:hypothetical protein